MSLKIRGKICVILAAVLAVATVLMLAPAVSAQAEKPSGAEVGAKGPGGSFSYAVKFVCGFNRTNVGVLSNGQAVGEATVKAGNYATDINIFNPGNDTEIAKKVLLLVKDDYPVGREPEFVGPSAFDEIALPTCTATMDDCNRIAELIYGPLGVPTPLPLTIGFLVLKSTSEIDVTAVYTSEVCSDFVVVGGAVMCSTAPGIAGIAAYGAGISIDVEQIQGRYVP